MWSAEISAEYCALPASRLYAKGDCFLYGYYNSNQHLIQVKICTAVDKEKWNYEKARRKLKTCNKKLINAEIAVFFCRKLLMFGVRLQKLLKQTVLMIYCMILINARDCLAR